MKLKFIATAIVCGMVSLTFAARVPLSDIQARKDGKNAISLFQPWAGISGGIIDTAKLHNNQKIALHDLVHNGPDAFGLKWKNADPLDTFPGNAEAFDSASIVRGLAMRAELLKLNPNIILIGEVRFFDARPDYYPPTSPYWKRTSSGGYDSSNYKPYLKLDYTKAVFQQHVAKQCIAMLETGVVDGIFLDWATDDYLPFFQAMRTLIGNEAVIIGNTNHHYTRIGKILPYLSGIFMESGWWGMTDNPTEFFKRVRSTIQMAEGALRPPKLINTEIWSQPNIPDIDSISTPGMMKITEPQRRLMRAGIAAHYTLTSGYYSFYPVTFKNMYKAEHMHVYDDFLNADLGKPTATPATKVGSAFSKEWEKGTVVYNPPEATGNATVTFTETRRSQALGTTGTSFVVPKGDGDIFLKGTFQQLYPAPEGFKSTGLPAIRTLPDTTYKDQFIVKTIHKSKVLPVVKTLKVNTIVRNQQVIIQKTEEGAATKYFNTQGRQIKVLQTNKK